MACKWMHNDCEVEDKKCHMCIIEDQMYIQKKIKQNKGLNKRAAKVTGRKGSHFELDNHNTNQAVLSGAASRMTPNSGAGYVKGDEEIRGLVEAAEELKTVTKVNSRGEKQFTIQKEWLDKLQNEQKITNKEFWYLKFAFGDHEPTNDWYVITKNDMHMSIIYTMQEDRKKALLAQSKIDVAEKRRQLTEAENIKLLAEIELLKTELKQKNQELEMAQKGMQI